MREQGRSHSVEGLREPCNVKAVASSRLAVKAAQWFPAPGWLAAGVRRFVRLRYRRGRVRGLAERLERLRPGAGSTAPVRGDG